MPAPAPTDRDAGTVDEMLSARPSPGLRGMVAGYSAYRQRGLAPMVHRGLPSPSLTVMFTFGVPLHVASHPDPRQPGGRYRSLVGGLHTTPALLTHDGEQAGIQVALSPLAARTVLGVPAGALASTDVDAGELLGPVAEEICDRLEEATSWAERVGALDAALAATLRREAPPTAPRYAEPGTWSSPPGAASASPT